MGKITLNHATEADADAGITVDQFGLGVYQAEVGVEAEQAVLWALEAGYRHIDTAAIYRNEGDVGSAIAKSGIPRNEIHVTTKLWSRGSGYKAPRRSIENSLERLGLDYVDLYLVHAPPALDFRIDTWHGMEQLMSLGKTRSIGVSNYGIHHLDAMLDYAHVMPSTNQIEISPYLQRSDLVKRCDELGIAITAYSPLTKGEKLNDPKLGKIAANYEKTPAQIMIRWCLQKGYIVIPKSVKQSRIAENINVFNFNISEADMATMAQFDENYITAWDPTTEP